MINIIKRGIYKSYFLSLLLTPIIILSVNSNADNLNLDLELAPITYKEMPKGVILKESFESMQDGDGWMVVGGKVVGDYGVLWDTHTNGVKAIRDATLSP